MNDHRRAYRHVIDIKCDKNQQLDISVKLRYMNAVVAITAPTRKIALKGITVRPPLKIETKSFLSQEKWKKNEQNVLSG